MNKIKDLRKELGLSYQAMADLMNLSKMTYWNKENGKTKFDIDNLIDLSKNIKIDMNDLLNDFYKGNL